MAKHKRRRMPKLSYTESQNIGFYASFRDPQTNTPRRKRFGMIPEADAKVQYAQWLADHMAGVNSSSLKNTTAPKPLPERSKARTITSLLVVNPGCLLAVANSWLCFEEARTRAEGESKTPGTITQRVYLDRNKHLQDFMRYMNQRHGPGALARMTLADLSMEDVEAYNRQIVQAGYSGSQVAKRMQVIKGLINRAGRPELGQQVLAWNWDAMDKRHGKATGQKTLPSLPQLKTLLKATDVRGHALIWMATAWGLANAIWRLFVLGRSTDRAMT